MVSAPADLTLEQAVQRRDLWRHGRVPIYDGEPDRVVGLVVRSEVLLASDRLDRTLRDIASDVVFVPELMRVDQLLDKLVAERRHIALVIDEYGQVEGLVTLEDVLAALIGQPLVDGLSAQPDLREQAERFAEVRREQLGVSEPDYGSPSASGGGPTT
jgi:CBS domain containing-hemolysin-like protein